jgi:hypothetical protein
VVRIYQHLDGLTGDLNACRNTEWRRTPPIAIYPRIGNFVPRAPVSADVETRKDTHGGLGRPNQREMPVAVSEHSKLGSEEPGRARDSSARAAIRASHRQQGHETAVNIRVTNVDGVLVKPYRYHNAARQQQTEGAPAGAARVKRRRATKFLL